MLGTAISTLQSLSNLIFTKALWEEYYYADVTYVKTYVREVESLAPLSYSRVIESGSYPDLTGSKAISLNHNRVPPTYCNCSQIKCRVSIC